MPSTLFISDLHLDAARSDITAQFLSFLAVEARKSAALYILGDLFETWIGDDDPDADKQRVQAALRNLTSSGIPCYVMHGNRDFLLGEAFLAKTGCRLLADPTTIDLNGRRVLLLHGDLLCTDDRAYQRLRRIVRNGLFQWVVGKLSLKLRVQLAARLRAGSQSHIDKTKRSAMEKIMDVNDACVVDTFTQHQVDLMIHGHTHRPAVHQLDVHGKPATRIVLGDWYTQGSVLKWDDRGYELLTLDRN